MNEEYLDTDGYPTDEALDKIRDWDYNDVKGWLNFIKSIWWASEWGWTETTGVNLTFDEPQYEYHISTGGWSGNEEIIDAMRKNYILWNLAWYEHRRGGHYMFAIPED